ncbi:MAG: hypothetical protein IPL39_17350 [Opitutaceae bacterium]|nr:hypothetical protein [Opitutaceae bacterium]
MLLGFVGFLHVVAGIRKLKATLEWRAPGSVRQGQIVSVYKTIIGGGRSAREVYRAVVEYTSDAGAVRRLNWESESEAMLGQSVYLKSKNDGSDEKEIAEPPATIAGSIFYILAGAAFLGAIILVADKR